MALTNEKTNVRLVLKYQRNVFQIWKVMEMSIVLSISEIFHKISQEFMQRKLTFTSKRCFLKFFQSIGQNDAETVWMIHCQIDLYCCYYYYYLI